VEFVEKIMEMDLDSVIEPSVKTCPGFSMAFLPYERRKGPRKKPHHGAWHILCWTCTTTHGLWNGAMRIMQSETIAYMHTVAKPAAT
jgi:hypothetical protein